MLSEINKVNKKHHTVHKFNNFNQLKLFYYLIIYLFKMAYVLLCQSIQYEYNLNKFWHLHLLNMSIFLTDYFQSTYLIMR